MTRWLAAWVVNPAAWVAGRLLDAADRALARRCDLGGEDYRRAGGHPVILYAPRPTPDAPDDDDELRERLRDWTPEEEA